MDGIAGILRQQRTGKLRTFAAMEKAFVLAAEGHRAFTVKRVPSGPDTAAAVFAEGTFPAKQAASCFNHGILDHRKNSTGIS